MAMNDDLKINIDKLDNAFKEANEKLEKMMDENNPFETIRKIAKDIADRKDKEVAFEFTKDIYTLLKNNGVSPVIEEYIQDIVKENSIEHKYGVTITGLDFTEHDKKFNDEIERLKKRIGKLASIRTRCHESARDSFDLGNYGCLHIVTADELKNTKDENDEIKAMRKELRESKDYITQLKQELEEKCSFETDRLVKLPFDALETANMLINATYKRKNCMTGIEYDKDIYSIDDLEQIAEHLLVYCKHHREDEE